MAANNKKAAPAGTGATPKNTSTQRHFTRARGAIKAAIVTLAVWGVIPARLASWLIQRGGLKHD